jgi:hypothetical protein
MRILSRELAVPLTALVLTRGRPSRHKDVLARAAGARRSELLARFTWFVRHLTGSEQSARVAPFAIGSEARARKSAAGEFCQMNNKHAVRRDFALGIEPRRCARRTHRHRLTRLALTRRIAPRTAKIRLRASQAGDDRCANAGKKAICSMS